MGTPPPNGLARTGWVAFWQGCNWQRCKCSCRKCGMRLLMSNGAIGSGNIIPAPESAQWQYQPPCRFRMLRYDQGNRSDSLLEVGNEVDLIT